jgi:hypothetical protein
MLVSKKSKRCIKSEALVRNSLKLHFIQVLGNRHEMISVCRESPSFRGGKSVKML